MDKPHLFRQLSIKTATIMDVRSAAGGQEYRSAATKSRGE